MYQSIKRFIINLYITFLQIFVLAVNLFPLNDVSICGGMKAHFSCTTTSTSRYFLLWSIDSVPVNDVFDNMTVVGSPFLKNGSVFTLTNRSIHSGIYTLTATAEINATQRTEVACSDGSFNPSHTVYLRGKIIINYAVYLCTSVCVISSDWCD